MKQTSRGEEESKGLVAKWRAWFLIFQKWIQGERRANKTMPTKAVFNVRSCQQLVHSWEDNRRLKVNINADRCIPGKRGALH